MANPLAFNLTPNAGYLEIRAIEAGAKWTEPQAWKRDERELNKRDRPQPCRYLDQSSPVAVNRSLEEIPFPVIFHPEVGQALHAWSARHSG